MKHFALYMVLFAAFGAVFWYAQKYLHSGSENTLKIKKPLIVCTTSILAQTISEIAGESLSIEALMGCDVDPHLYKPRAHDIYKLAEADVIIHNGLHLEGKMSEILNSLSEQGKNVYVASEAIHLSLLRSTEYKGIYDPHIWSDVSLWIIVAKGIKTYLSKIFPQHAALFEQNSERYILSLRNLDEWIKNQINTIPKERRFIISAHDAFSYFGGAYGMKVEALQGISTDAEISILDIENISRIIIENSIPTIFVEQTVPEKYLKGIQTIVMQNRKDVRIGKKLYSDSLGSSESGITTYVRMMEHNVNAFVDGLKQ